MYNYNNPYPYSQSYQQPYNRNLSYMQQPQPQMPSTPQNSAPSAFNYDTPIQDIRFVNKAQAEAFLVYPNTTVLLIDKELGVAHLKSADSTGLSKTKLYKIEEINPDGTAVKQNQSTQSINMEDFSKKFVTIEQYDSLVAKIKALQEIIVSQKNVQPKQTSGT